MEMAIVDGMRCEITQSTSLMSITALVRSVLVAESTDKH